MFCNVLTAYPKQFACINLYALGDLTFKAWQKATTFLAVGAFGFLWRATNALTIPIQRQSLAPGTLEYHE
eukprot:5287305-Ditylum_brightwellii.AAC.1